jgi:hypothetical protein
MAKGWERRGGDYEVEKGEGSELDVEGVERSEGVVSWIRFTDAVMVLLELAEVTPETAEEGKVDLSVVPHLLEELFKRQIVIFFFLRELVATVVLEVPFVGDFVPDSIAEDIKVAVAQSAFFKDEAEAQLETLVHGIGRRWSTRENAYVGEALAVRAERMEDEREEVVVAGAILDDEASELIKDA